MSSMYRIPKYERLFTLLTAILALALFVVTFDAKAATITLGSVQRLVYWRVINTVIVLLTVRY